LWKAVGQTDGVDQLEVASSVFLVTKEGVRDLVGGIVDGNDEDKIRTPPLEPVVMATVYLQQHPTEREPVPPGAMARGTTFARAPLADGAAQAAHRGARDGDAVLLVELLGEVGVVVVLERPSCQLQDLLSSVERYPVGRGTTTIAVGKARCTLQPVRSEESSYLPDRKA
jgi:hypothetical protein